MKVFCETGCQLLFSVKFSLKEDVLKVKREKELERVTSYLHVFPHSLNKAIPCGSKIRDFNYFYIKNFEVTTE